jgi:hypothetical protein
MGSGNWTNAVGGAEYRIVGRGQGVSTDDEGLFPRSILPEKLINVFEADQFKLKHRTESVHHFPKSRITPEV